MGVYVHVQLVLTTVIHLAALITGLGSVSTLFLAKKKANGKCLLFMTLNEEDKPTSLFNDGPNHICDFEAFLPCATSIYAFILLVYFGYGAKVATTREQHVGRSLWVMPFLLLGALVSVFTIVGACILTVGSLSTCKELIDYKLNDKCNGAMSARLHIDGSEVANYLKQAEIFYWAHFVCWFASLPLLIIRVLRNKKARTLTTRDTTDTPFPDPSIASERTNSDTRGLTEMQPTA